MWLFSVFLYPLVNISPHDHHLPPWSPSSSSLVTIILPLGHLPPPQWSPSSSPLVTIILPRGHHPPPLWSPSSSCNHRPPHTTTTLSPLLPPTNDEHLLPHDHCYSSPESWDQLVLQKSWRSTFLLGVSKQWHPSVWGRLSSLHTVLSPHSLCFLRTGPTSLSSEPQTAGGSCRRLT